MSSLYMITDNTIYRQIFDTFVCLTLSMLISIADPINVRITREGQGSNQFYNNHSRKSFLLILLTFAKLTL